MKKKKDMASRTRENIRDIQNSMEGGATKLEEGGSPTIKTEAPAAISANPRPVMISQSIQTEEGTSPAIYVEVSTSTIVEPGPIMISQAAQIEDTPDIDEAPTSTNVTPSATTISSSAQTNDPANVKEEPHHGANVNSSGDAAELLHYSQINDLLAFSLVNEDNPARSYGPLQHIRLASDYNH